MSKIKELRQRKADLIKEGRELLDKAEAESRDLNESEAARYEDIDKQAEALNKSIEREERQLQRERESGAVKDDEDANKRSAEPNYRSLGEMLRDVYLASNVERPNAQALASLRAATGMGETVSSDGGFLVQKDFSAELLKRTYEMGQISSRVNRIPVTGNGLRINAVDETSRANGSRWGGILAYWADEAEALTAKKPKFRQMELSLKKLTGLCYATDELLQDASALETVISQAFSEEFSFKVEDAIINGTGAGTPLGILNGGSKVAVTKETGQAAATIKFENIVKMWSRLWARSQQNAVWFVNQDVLPQLIGLNMAVGTGGAPVFMPPGGLSGAPYGTLMGRPVIPVEYCATVGTEGDIILADLSQYLMIDKGGINAASSMHVRFIYDEMAYRFIYRVDGQPIWNSALTPKNGSNTLSPFVTLATRS